MKIKVIAVVLLALYFLIDSTTVAVAIAEVHSNEFLNISVEDTLDRELDGKFSEALAGLKDEDFWRARLLYKKREYAEAIKVCDKQLQKFPEYATALRLRAFAVERLKNKGKSSVVTLTISECRHGRNVQISDTDVLNSMLADDLADISQFNFVDKKVSMYAWAEKACTRALAIYPKNTERYLWVLSNIHKAEKKYKDALNNLNELIALNDKDASYYSERSSILDRLHSHDAAAIDREKSIALDPSYKHIYADVSPPYSSTPIQIDRVAESRNRLQYLISLPLTKVAVSRMSPNDSLYNDFVRRLAVGYYAAGDYDAVIKTTDQLMINAAERNFMFQVTDHYLRGHAYRNSLKYDEAINCYTAGLDAGSDWYNDGNAYYCRGLCHQALKHDDLAQADFEEARQKGFAGPAETMFR